MSHETSTVRALIVDDDPVSRRWLGGCLARDGVACEEASDAETARRALERGGHDVVLLDLFLGSGATGLDVLTWMRARPELDHVGVIIVSANAGDESAVALALQRGADDYLVKPIRPVELAARVTAVRRRSARRVEPARARSEDPDVSDRLQHAMQLETVGRLAGGIAHDFNNLLTGITSNADLGLDDAPRGSAAREALEEIQRAATTAVALTRQLASFSRTPTVEPTLLDPNDLIESLRKMLRRLLGDDIRVVFTPHQQHGIVRIDPVQLELALVNLALNARHAMPRGGELRLTTSDVSADTLPSKPVSGPRRYIRIDVSDTGHGMSPEIQARVFEPFFTTKARGQGTGFGLANVRRFVEEAGGFIDVESVAGSSTTFHLYLPRERTTAPLAARREDHAPIFEGLRGKSVLVVDDDELVRRASVRVLQRSGADVLVAASAPEAVELARDLTRTIDLVLTDLVMPDMSGSDVARHIRAIRPGMPIVCASGHGREELVEQGVCDADEIAFLAKPFTPAALVAKVSEALAA